VRQEAGQLEVGPAYAPGIRGWLVFFSIGVWAMPLLLAWSSMQGLLGFKREFDKAAGRPLDLKMIGVLLQDLPESWDAAFLLCLVVAIVALYGALISVSIWLITQWWQRKQHFPTWCALKVQVRPRSKVHRASDRTAAERGRGDRGAARRWTAS
jgi:hypothetical protein